MEMFHRFLAAPFAEKFGVEVRTPGRSEYFIDDVAADLAEGGSRFDVIEWPQYDFHRAKRLGLCEKIDYASLPNVANVGAQFLDPDGYGVGVFVYGMLPVYIPSLVPRPLTSWADLWDPAFRGTIALRDQLVAGKLMAITCKVMGISTEDLKDDAVYERAWAKLEALVRNAGHWAISEGHIQDLMAAREVAVSHNFIDVAQIQKERGVEIEIVFPEDGPVWAYRSWTVVKGCKRPDLAREFINFAQSEDRQKALCDTFYGLPTNGRTKVDPVVYRKLSGSDGVTEIPLTFPTWDWYFERPDAEARWQGLVGKGRLGGAV
jgi:putative spermidine/putrescine transport system substrate-binding protein